MGRGRLHALRGFLLSAQQPRKTRRRRGNVVVRGVLREQVDVQKLGRAVLALMAAQEEAEAAAQHAAQAEEDVAS